MNRLFAILLLLFATGQIYSQRVQDTCASDLPIRYTISGAAGMKYHWHAAGGQITNADSLTNTIWVKWPQSPNDYSLSVTGELGGCITETKSIIVRIRKSPLVNLGQDIEMCQGEQHTFQVPAGFKSIEWQNGTSNSWYTADSTQTVWVKVTNFASCSAFDTANVLVDPVPYVSLGHDTTLCFNSQLVLNAGNEGSIYNWSDNSIGKTYTVNKYDKDVWVRVINVFGCSASDTLHMGVCKIALDPDKLPSAVSPNGDGINDVWMIPGIEDYPDAVVKIYNRWGQLMFESKPGYPAPWDCKTSMGVAPMDAYFYIIDLKVKGKDPVVGTVTVIP